MIKSAIWLSIYPSLLAHKCFDHLVAYKLNIQNFARRKQDLQHKISID